MVRSRQIGAMTQIKAIGEAAGRMGRARGPAGTAGAAIAGAGLPILPPAGTRCQGR
jgi:hypothetical protein